MTRPRLRARRDPWPRRGAILLEVLVSLAIFAAAGAALLASMRDVTRGLDRDERVAQAADLARSRMSELEAGLTTIEDLRGAGAGGGSGGGSGRGSGSAGRGTRATERRDPEWTRFTVDVKASRSEIPNLSLVEITVSGENQELLYTLRQLLPLGDAKSGSGSLSSRRGSGGPP